MSTTSTDPRFCELSTADGVRYGDIAELRGADVLANTLPLPTASQLAEVSEAASRLDGVRLVVLSAECTITQLARCVRAILGAVPDLVVQVHVSAPTDEEWALLHRTGATVVFDLDFDSQGEIYDGPVNLQVA